MHFIIVLTSLITTHEAQSPIGGGSGASLRQMHRYVAVLSHHLRSIVATTPGVSSTLKLAGPGNPSFAPFCMASCRQSTVPLCGGASLRQMHRYVAVLWHHLRSIVATTPGVSWLAVVRSRVSAGWL